MNTKFSKWVKPYQMKQFKKLKVTIEHIETSTGHVATQMHVKGTSQFTLEEINSTIVAAKKEWFKQAVERIEGRNNLKPVK